MVNNSLIKNTITDATKPIAVSTQALADKSRPGRQVRIALAGTPGLIEAKTAYPVRLYKPKPPMRQIFPGDRVVERPRPEGEEHYPYKGWAKRTPHVPRKPRPHRHTQPCFSTIVITGPTHPQQAFELDKPPSVQDYFFL